MEWVFVRDEIKVWSKLGRIGRQFIPTLKKTPITDSSLLLNNP